MDQGSRLFGSRPNMKNYNTSPIKNLLSTAKSALIVSPQLSIDAVAASLALALSLQKNGLSVKIFCPQKIDQNYSKLSGTDLLTDSYSDNDLIITINHPLDQIDQVSYNDDNQKLNLVVKTKPDSPRIDNQKIIINNQSASADVCFMLGDESPLGANSQMVNKGNWVFISPVNVNKTWAKASLIDQDAPFCEIFTFLLPMLDLKIDADCGKNLLIGLRVSTQSFSINVSPETFEAGARCLRATQAHPPVSGQTLTPSVQPPNVTPIQSVESAPVSKFQPDKNSPLPTA